MSAADTSDLTPGPGFPSRVIPTPLLQQVAVGIAPGLKRWTATEYHQMIQQGLILEGAPIELIDGALVYKDRRDARGSVMPYGPRHAAAVYQLTTLVQLLKDHGCYLQTQATILVSEDHEPEPDGAIVRGTIREHRDALPTAAEVVVVMEVSDSSLEYDRGAKQRIYATAEIPTYWILNLRNHTVEVYEQPEAQAGEYRVRRDYQLGETIEARLPDGTILAIPVGDLIG